LCAIDISMKTRNALSNWLVFYEQRDKRSLSLWITFVGWTLTTLCVFAGFNEVERLIESTADINTALNQNGVPLLVSKYSIAEKYLFWIRGVEYQLVIALALIIRLLALVAYRCWGSSSRRKWLGIVIADLSLIVAVATFAWYSAFSYRVLFIETVCEGCAPPTQFLVGASYLWSVLLTFVMLVQTIYGIGRLAVPLLDMRRASRGRLET
jgi:hypothetical protein